MDTSHETERTQLMEQRRMFVR